MAVGTRGAPEGSATAFLRRSRQACRSVWRAVVTARSTRAGSVMPLHVQAVGVTADLTIRVPRDADGSLTDGARVVLERLEDVEAVESVDLTGVEPRLNDLTVDVEATVTVAGDGTEDAAARALDGFGVTVNEVAVAR